MKFKKYIQISMAGPLIISVIILMFASVTWSKNIYTGIIYLAVGLIQLISSILLHFQISKREDLTEIGSISVQFNWLILSISLTGCILFLASFFTVTPIWIPYAAFLLCLIMVLWCAINLYKTVKETKVPLAT